MKKILKNIVDKFYGDNEVPYEFCRLIRRNGINNVDGEILKMLEDLEESKRVYEIYTDTDNGYDGSNPLSCADPDYIVINGRSVGKTYGKYFSEKNR